MIEFILICIAAFAFIVILYLLFQSHQYAKGLEGELNELKIDRARLQTHLEEQRKSYQEKLILIDESKEKLKDVFKGISTEALEKIEERAFKEEERRNRMWSDLVKPMKESLSKLDDKMGSIEKERKGEKATLAEQIKQMMESEKVILKETKGLKDALSKPEIRGMWGELQLKRVVEISGMVNNCDFIEQSVNETDASRIRPDLIIKLSGGRQIIVDAKAPFEGFLKALSTEDANEKNIQLERHARHLKNHIQMLSKKKYYEGFTDTPEFVVLFLPSEVFFSAAMQMDASLIEFAAREGVILATPTTLIGLLRAVAYGWKSETMTIHAKAIQSLGAELYKRLIDMSKHLQTMGRSLNAAVDGYNKTIGSFERRVLTSARKFHEYGAASGDTLMPVFEPIDTQTRSVEQLHLDSEEVTVD